MSARLIHFIPEHLSGSYVEVLAYTAGAWSLACSTLWPSCKFSRDEIEQTKLFIASYFEHAGNRRKALVAFTERIFLARQFYASKKAVLDKPSTWFDPSNPLGFADTKSILIQVNEKRKTQAKYLRHFTVVAQYFQRYITNPSAHVFNGCQNKLASLKAPHLLRHFNNAILHYNYIKQ